jgi:ribokinase
MSSPPHGKGLDELATGSALASHELMRSAARTASAADSPAASPRRATAPPAEPECGESDAAPSSGSTLVSSIRAGHESIRSAASYSFAASDGVVAASLDIAAELSALSTLSRVMAEGPPSSASAGSAEPELVIPADSARAGHASIRSAARAAASADAVVAASQEVDRDVEYCAHAALRSAARSILSLGTVLQSAEPGDGPPAVAAPHAAVRSAAASILSLDSVVDAELGSLSPSKTAAARALVSPPKKTLTPKPRKPSNAVQQPSTLLFDAAADAAADASEIDNAAPLLCVGSLNVDLIAYMPHFPAPGETLMGTTFQQGPGGKGANQACAAALLSARGCVMIGAVGDDALGADYLRAGGSFLRAGVDASHVLIRPGVSTGVAPIWVNAEGENSIVVVPGANATLTAGEVDAAMQRAGACAGVLVQLEVPLEATVAALRGAAAARVPSFFTPAPAPAAGLPDVALALASVLIPNRGELFSLSGGGGVTEGDDALRARVAILQARGANSVVVTLGAEGALVVGQGGQSALVRAPRVTAVDTSGAGDAFSGSLAFFATALKRATTEIAGAATSGGGGDGDALGECRAVAVPFDVLVEAARRAVYVAAQTVTKKGTQSSYARRADLSQDLFSRDLGFVPAGSDDGLEAITVVAAPVVTPAPAPVPVSTPVPVPAPAPVALTPVASTPPSAIKPRNIALSTDLDWVRPEVVRLSPRTTPPHAKDDKSNC